MPGITKPLRKEPERMERYTSQTPLSAPTKETLALLKNASAHLHKEYISYITGCDADARHKYAVFCYMLLLSAN